tara:strand:+ start:8664 stop:10667 length:2004 start_codon:yes stop_codon:yes gene_type:complete
MPKIIDLNTGKLVDSEDHSVDSAGTFSGNTPQLIDLETGNLTTEVPTQISTEEQIIDRDFALYDLAKSKSPLEAGLISAGKTVVDLGRFLGFGGEESEIEKQALKVLRDENPISTAVGQAAPFLAPGIGAANIASLPARVAASGAIGATEGATIASGTDQDISTGAGVGAVIGSGLELAFPILGKISGQLFKKITGKNPKTPLVNRDGQPTQELTDALDKAGLDFKDLTDEAKISGVSNVDDATNIIREDFLRDNDLIPTKAQVTSDASDFQMQQELAKKSGKVRSILEGNEQVISNKFDNAISETGGTANPSNSPVFDFIGDKAIELDSAIHDAYQGAKAAAGDNKIVKASSLVKTLRGAAPKEKISKGIFSAVRGILKDKGVLIGNELKTQSRFSPKVAEEVRAEMNGLFESLSPVGKDILKDLKEALDNDVARDVGEEFFEGARAMKTKFEKDLSRSKINKFDVRKKELVRDILGNKINPENFLKEAVLSKTVRSIDLKELKKYLHLDDNPLGVQAWNDLRAESLDFIKNTAIKNVGGAPSITRTQMDKAINQFGRDKLRVLFDKKELAELDKFSKIAILKEPKRATAIGKGPSAQAFKHSPIFNEFFEGIGEAMANRAALTIPKPIKGVKAKVAQPAVSSGTIAAEDKRKGIHIDIKKKAGEK